MGNKRKKGSAIQVRTLFAFGRGCGEPLIAPSPISPYAQVSTRLEGLGHSRASFESAKNHCVRFLDVILKYAQGHHKPKTTYPSKKVWTPTASTDPSSDAFLSTYEWRRVRMMALKKYGAVCQCCGASPKTGAVMNVDHIKPRKLFPALALELDNLQVLCHDCNHGKGNWDMTDWRDVAADSI